MVFTYLYGKLKEGQQLIPYEEALFTGCCTLGYVPAIHPIRRYMYL